MNNIINAENIEKEYDFEKALKEKDAKIKKLSDRLKIASFTIIFFTFVYLYDKIKYLLYLLFH